MDLNAFPESMKSGGRMTLRTEKPRNQLNRDLDQIGQRQVAK
jgi:hypothetical protein